MKARRFTLAVLGAALAMLVPGATAALASLARAPETERPEAVGSEGALLVGLLNPGKSGAPGTYENATYQFLYRASSTECKGGSQTSEGSSRGGGSELVKQQVSGLEPDTRYSVCLVIHEGEEEIVGSRITFVTEAPQTGAASEVTATSAKLTGVLHPEHEGEAGSYRFRYLSSLVECETTFVSEGRLRYFAESTPSGEATGKSGQAVEELVTGLAPGTYYSFCLQAEAGSEVVDGSPVTFKTQPLAPQVGGERAIAVGSDEATVEAAISAGGLPASYHVEYGTSAAYGSSTPEVSLGDNGEYVSVRVRLGGLQPGVEYHFRFAANSQLGPGTGADATLRTNPSSGAAASTLPDQRVWELVSNTDYDGEIYSPLAPTYQLQDTHTGQLFRAAADGNSVIYEADPANSGGNGNTGNGEGNTWLATRGSEGWQTSDITPVGSEGGVIYEAFSRELTSGILETNKPKLTAAAPAGCQDLYLRQSADGAERALITTADVPGHCGHPHYAGASADETQIIFQDEAALTANAQPAEPSEIGGGAHNNSGDEMGEACELSCNLYENVGGELRLVNVLPDGEADPNASFGGPSDMGATGPDLSGAISTDGSRIFWTDTKAGADREHIYVFENGSTNVQVSGAGEAKFWAATPDGRYALYTEGEDLWRFDTATNTREELLSKGIEGENAGVQAVLGVNQTGEDGAYLYLMATGKLADNANSHGEMAQVGLDNVYLLHAGVVTFVAALEAEEASNLEAGQGFSQPVNFGDAVPAIGNRTAEVTPDGRGLLFESLRALTGYDNEDTADHNPVVELFVYSAESATLACASCNPTGALPQILTDRDWTLVPVSGSDTYALRLISEDGAHVFFTTPQPLLPQDTNGVQDVYEWEREGTPDCPQISPPRRDGGCVFLLSGGENSDNSYLVDASADGSDVFFTTRAQLVLQDGNEKVDLYDARVDGFRPITPPLCSGTGCQGVPPGQPIFSTPSSVTYEGVGNFEPAPPALVKPKKRTSQACRKGFVKKHGRCVKRPTKRHAAKHGKRAGTSGGHANSGRQK